MKIAFIYDAVYPWVKGGAEKRVYEIAMRLVERGHDVHWYGVKWWDGSDVIDHRGIHLHGVCQPRSLYVNGRRSISEALIFAIKLLPAMNERYDIIDCQEFPYLSCFSVKIYSKVKKIPLVITWHEYWGDYWFEYLGAAGIFGKYIELLTKKLAKHNVAVSETTRNRLNIDIKKNIKIIPNGINFDEIQKIPPIFTKSDVIFSGRFIKEKNIDYLIRAIGTISHTYPDIKCLIIGDGPEYQKIIALIKNLNLTQNIELKPFFEDHNDIIGCMKSSKVFVSPSMREGFGIVALEAQASGLPVITIKHSLNAVQDFITNKTGILCSLSVESLADAMIKGIQFHEKMKEDCISQSAKYDWMNIVDQIESYYTDITT